MSGFLPDIANWALRGGAANNNEEEEEEDTEEEEENPQKPVPMSPEELRAQRVARMQALQQQRSQTEQSQPMDIDDDDDESPRKPAPKPRKSPVSPRKEKVAVPAPVAPKIAVVKKPKEDLSPGEQAKRHQRKKELIIRKTLHVVLAGGSVEKTGFVQVDTGSTEISVSSVAEILATRLSNSETTPLVMRYLGSCYNRCTTELNQLKPGKKRTSNADLEEILQEILKQVVSYAATCLVAPDLFPYMAKQAHGQLAQCLLKSAEPNTTSISDDSNLMKAGLSGNSSCFYNQLMEELREQSPDTLNTTVAAMVDFFSKLLDKCDSVFDTTTAPSVEGNETISTSPVVILTALGYLCSHKSAALAVTQMDSFLLPKPGTYEATRVIRPQLPTGPNALQQFMAIADAQRVPYAGRSGPALERQTILGLCLKIGTPIMNPSFPSGSATRQTLHAVENTFASQRRQLSAYQQMCHQLTMAFIKGGKDARARVLEWFTDALLVNVGASAMSPNPAKVSGRNLILNMSVVLLKLCDPFVGDSKGKQHLIDPGFVSSAKDHGGVFATDGDDLVPRLGTADDGTDMEVDTPYEPKNAFIPQCFFYCARALHFGIVAQLARHENLLRNINFRHHQLQSHNRDVHTDPGFSSLIARQRSAEVSLFQEEMVDSSLRFANFMAKVLFDMDDATLRTIPEDFVSDVCSLLQSMVQQQSKQITGQDFRYVFKLVVKLLSSKYASMVRNYKLRAQKGDVLHEIFLPRDGTERRDLSSIACDPLAGGVTFLLSDSSAQESLAPSLLLLYGEVEHTGYYEKMSHRAKIASLIKYLWESKEHRPAFRRITQNRESFIKFAHGIMNETNTLIATVMQKLPEIREAQQKMKDTAAWGRLTEDEQEQISSRLDDNERDVKSALPLCNKTLQMFGYLNTDDDIRNLFLLDELCSRLVSMLVHVLTKLVGSKGLELKVDNPEQYEFRPKEMLRDLCAIFGLFAAKPTFREECAKSGCDPALLRGALKTCKKLNLLTGESLEAFTALPAAVEAAAQQVADDEQMLVDAPDEFNDEILTTFMKDPVVLPSGHYVDRSTITQHLLNDPTDPFTREPLTIEQVKPAAELKERIDKWLTEKRASRANNN